MQDRVADLEAALVQVEAISKAKCNEMAVATAAEIQRVEGTYHGEYTHLTSQYKGGFTQQRENTHLI